MRILYIAPNQIGKYNWGHELLRRSIAKVHDVTFYGPGHPGWYKPASVPWVLEHSNKTFDLIITDMQKYSYWVRYLGRVKNIPKVHILVDYVEEIKNGAEWQDSFFDNQYIDLFFAHSIVEMDCFKERRSEPVMYLPYSVDTDVYCDLNCERNVDIACIWNRGSGYPNRTEIREKILPRLKKTKGYNITRSKVNKLEYINALNHTKIFIGSVNQWKGLGMKVTEALACKSLFLTDEPDDFIIQGFEDGKHLVLYNDLDDMIGKIEYYLKDEVLRHTIASQGYSFVREHHSNAVRVQQMFKHIEQALGVSV